MKSQNNISIKDLSPTIKEVVNSGGRATFTPFGISMKPMLYGGRDEIILVKPTFPLKKYDLPFYTSPSGKMILHRVVKADKNGYIMRGDNTYFNETGITDSDVIAVVSQFKRKGKWHSVTEPGYKVYCRLWVLTYPIRKILIKIKRKIGSGC